MFVAWEMLQRVKGDHGIEGGSRELDRARIAVDVGSGGNVLPRQVDLGTGDVDAGDGVPPRDLDIGRRA